MPIACQITVLDFWEAYWLILFVKMVKTWGTESLWCLVNIYFSFKIGFDSSSIRGQVREVGDKVPRPVIGPARPKWITYTGQINPQHKKHTKTYSTVTHIYYRSNLEVAFPREIPSHAINLNPGDLGVWLRDFLRESLNSIQFWLFKKDIDKRSFINR